MTAASGNLLASCNAPKFRGHLMRSPAQEDLENSFLGAEMRPHGMHVLYCRLTCMFLYDRKGLLHIQISLRQLFHILLYFSCLYIQFPTTVKERHMISVRPSSWAALYLHSSYNLSVTRLTSGQKELGINLGMVFEPNPCNCRVSICNFPSSSG